MFRLYTKCPECGAIEKAGSQFAIFERNKASFIRFLNEDEEIEEEIESEDCVKCICPNCGTEFKDSELEAFIIEKEDEND